MAGIHNYQRRALERLMEGRAEKTIEVCGNRRYFLEGKEVFFWGVSRGVGTCSDLHGVDIAVFGETKTDGKIHEVSARSLAFARVSFAEEFPADGVARKVVEELEATENAPDKIVFARTGRKEAYVNTIG